MSFLFSSNHRLLCLPALLAALTIASAFPSLTRSMATLIEASFFLRIASLEDSLINTTYPALRCWASEYRR